MIRLRDALAVSALFGTVLLGSLALASRETGDGAEDAARFRTELLGVPLTDLCWVLEKRSGIPHVVADAATGDLTLSALGEMTVAELREAAADTLGIAWKTEERDGKRRYVAARLPETVSEEARVVSEMDRAFREGLQKLVAAAQLPEEERRRLPEELTSQVSGYHGDAARMFAALSAPEQARLLDQDTIVRPVRELPAAAQAHLKALADGLNVAATGSRRIDLTNGADWRVRMAPRSMSIPGNIVFEVLLFSPLNRGIGTGLTIRVPDLVSEDPRGRRLPRTTTGTAKSVSAALVAPSLSVQAMRWDALLVDLARGLHTPIVSDAYHGELVNVVYRTPPAQLGETIETFLDRSSPGWSRRWGHVNAVLTFQRADWPLMRRAQIPESVARRWRRHILDTGRVAVDDLAEMAALPPRQMNDLRWIAASQSDAVVQYRDLLLFWRSLPISTRGRLTKGSLFLRDLPQAAQPRAKALLAVALETQAPLALGNARLGVEQSEDMLVLSIHSPDRPPVTRGVDLRVRPDLVQRVKQEEEAREAALRQAAGVDAAAAAGSAGAARPPAAAP